MVLGLLLGGVVALDPAAFANLPWRGLAPPTAAPSETAGPDLRAADEPRVNRHARPPASPPASAPVLSLPGAFPSAGPGSFRYANTRGAVMGTAGTLRRFHVGVESGVEEDLDAVAATIDQSLGDRRGWTASRQVRLQRVPPGERSDFTIFLATGETARQMCAQGGVNIVVNGEPYTSCRATGQVILNLNRWRLSVPDYVAQRVPLAVYRQYLINHEVGHELGHGHELCTGRGRPAPVMQQQTLGLRGCTANPWPYLDGKRYAGPPGPS